MNPQKILGRHIFDSISDVAKIMPRAQSVGPENRSDGSTVAASPHLAPLAAGEFLTNPNEIAD